MHGVAMRIWVPGASGWALSRHLMLEGESAQEAGLHEDKTTDQKTTIRINHPDPLKATKGTLHPNRGSNSRSSSGCLLPHL